MNPIKSAIIQNSRYGVKDRCLSFDGTDDYVDCGSFQSFVDVSGDLPFTVEFWAYKNEGYTQWRSVSKFNANTGDREWYVSINDDGRIFILLCQNTSISNRITCSTDVSTPIANEIFFHIACIYDGSKTKEGLDIYVNAILETHSQAETGTYPGMTSGSAHLLIGAQSSVTNNPTEPANLFNGKIDEVRIWNHVRTADQIKRYMHTRLYGTETGLVAYYPMNEGTGATAYDKSTNSNDGTITGATWIKP
jgi:hypothetical protein